MNLSPLAKPPRACLGFTLYELIIVLGLVGILTVFAVPSFQTSIADQRVKAFAHDLYNAFTEARAAALKYNGACSVFIQPEDTTDWDWSKGWFLVADTDASVGATNCTLDPDPATAFSGDPAANDALILSRLDPGEDEAAISVTGAPSASILFNRRGRIRSPAGTLDFTVCDDSGRATRRDLQISVSGMPEIRINGAC